MTDSAPPIPPAPEERPDEAPTAAPFGAGVPQEPAEQVRAVPLRPGERRGPTIDVRAQAGTAGPAPGAPPPRPAHAAGVEPGPAGGSAAAGPPPPPSGAARPAAQPRSANRVWIALCHLMYLIPLALPGVILTTAIWMWKRGEDPVVADQGREALNMQLTFWGITALLGLTCLAAPLGVLVWVVGAIYCVLAAIQASSGNAYRYPWVLRIIA